MVLVCILQIHSLTWKDWKLHIDHVLKIYICMLKLQIHYKKRIKEVHAFKMKFNLSTQPPDYKPVDISPHILFSQIDKHGIGRVILLSKSKHFATNTRPVCRSSTHIAARDYSIDYMNLEIPV